MKQGLALIAFIACILVCTGYCLRYSLSFVYDVLYDNPAVDSIQGVDKVFSQLGSVDLTKLTPAYLSHAGIDTKEAKAALGGQYYLVPEELLMKKVLGSNRLKSIASHGWIDDKRPLLIDKRVLYAFIKLYSLLKKRGHDPDALVITSGHRHPNHNKEANGAKNSRHVKGQAIDLQVGDVNRDGVIGFSDKKIVYRLLDTVVIKNKGGIGRYPHSKRALHFDVRGYRARWDSF